MQLHPPFEIGPRLLPALRVGGGWLALEHVGCRGSRLVYRWYADIPAGEFTQADLSSPRDDPQEAFGALLDFLSAAADGLAYQKRAGRETENADLFPRPVVEWAMEHDGELSTLREQVEGGKRLIMEEDET